MATLMLWTNWKSGYSIQGYWTEVIRQATITVKATMRFSCRLFAIVRISLSFLGKLGWPNSRIGSILCFLIFCTYSCGDLRKGYWIAANDAYVCDEQVIIPIPISDAQTGTDGDVFHFSLKYAHAHREDVRYNDGKMGNIMKALEVFSCPQCAYCQPCRGIAQILHR